MIQGKTHVYRTSIDFDLLDAGSVVHHPNYLVLCERARSQAITDAGYPAKELWRDGFALALTESRSSYLRPLGLSDSVVILTKLESCYGVRLVVRQCISLVGNESACPSQGYQSEWLDLGGVAYTLDVTLACVRLSPIRSVRFPERLLTALNLPLGRKKTSEDEATL